MYNGSAMDSIGKIFAAIDGVVPDDPFRSLTARLPDGRMCAAAAGRIYAGCYVAYLEEPRGVDDEPVVGGEAFVDENIELAAPKDPPSIEPDRAPEVNTREPSFHVRYLEYFPDPFKAGERYQFFREALNPTPEEDSTNEEMERDHVRGQSRVEDFITRRINRNLIDEFLHAEEILEDSGASAFWEQARLTAYEELLGRIPEHTLEKDLELHRFRRAALRDNEEHDEETNL
ncbi:MAG: hypothetical protein ACFB50_14630 [Rubrobacteraceae bacterium]